MFGFKKNGVNVDVFRNWTLACARTDIVIGRKWVKFPFWWNYLFKNLLQSTESEVTVIGSQTSLHIIFKLL